MIPITKIKTLRMVDKPSQWLPSEAEPHHSQGQKTIAKVEKNLAFFTQFVCLLCYLCPGFEHCIDTHPVHLRCPPLLIDGSYDAHASIGIYVVLKSCRSWFIIFIETTVRLPLSDWQSC